MESAVRRLEAADQGERALQESLALLGCLKEACEGQGQFRMPHVAIVLAVIADCLLRAQQALQDLAS